MATRLATKFALEVVHSDSLISLGWSQASDEVARLIEAGPGIFEGVAVVRSLRKLIARNSTKPVDLVIVLHTPLIELSKGQEGMRKAGETMLAEIEQELRARGVALEHIR